MLGGKCARQRPAGRVLRLRRAARPTPRDRADRLDQRGLRLLQGADLQPQQRARPALAVRPTLWAGQPWKTATMVRAARPSSPPAPDGMTGNDDLGTMSAWYVFSSLGLYPTMSGANFYGVVLAAVPGGARGRSAPTASRAGRCRSPRPARARTTATSGRPRSTGVTSVAPTCASARSHRAGGSTTCSAASPAAGGRGASDIPPSVDGGTAFTTTEARRPAVAGAGVRPAVRRRRAAGAAQPRPRRG